MKRSFAETIMNMKESTWERHAHPGSVYTRLLSFPAMVYGIWLFKSQELKWAILFNLVFYLWIFCNTRIFPVPKSTNNWASKITFGERVWLKHKNLVPAHHKNMMIPLLLFISFLGLLGMITFTYLGNLQLMIGSSVICWVGKVWFCDRMVWLFQDVQDNPLFEGWIR